MANFHKIATLLIILMAACAPTYFPNSRNTPLLERKGELQVSGGLGNGLELQSAIGVSNHLGVMLNLSLADRIVSENTASYRKQYFAESAIGYYGGSGKFRFELYGGSGFGSSESLGTATFGSNTTTYFAEGNYLRAFLMPNLGYKGDFWEFILSTRMSYVHFLSYYSDRRSSPYELGSMFFEPAFTLKLGRDPLKLLAQLGVNVGLNEQFDPNYTLVNMQLGVQYRFNKVFQ